MILSQWYPPEPMAIYAELAESLARMGHKVTVVTGFPNYPTGKLYEGYRLGAPRREERNGVSILRVPLFPDHSRSKVRRFLNLASFAVSAALFSALLLRPPDVIHTVQPPTASVASWILTRLWKVPSVYEIQDMWPETLPATGMIGRGWVLRCVGAFCDWVHRRAAAIRVISPGFRENLIKKGVPEQKIHVIPNWVDTDHYQSLPRDIAFAEALGAAKTFNVVYAGNMGLAQGLDNVINTAELLSVHEDIQFLMFGQGVELERLRREAEDRRLENIRFLGYHSPHEMNRVYSIADALLINMSSDPLFEITIPHKTLAYLAVGKPIIAAVGGDTATVVRDANAGISCRAGDPEALAGAVLSLYHLSPQGRAEMGLSGRKAACERFSRAVLVARISEMEQGVVAQTKKACKK